jgi:hypothetical protein
MPNGAERVEFSSIFIKGIARMKKMQQWVSDA